MPAVAFCPCPPLLVPELAAGAARELDHLRAACDDVVTRLVATAGHVTVVGGGAVSQVHPSSAAASFAGFGVDVRAGGPGEPVLPLSLAVGAWLLDRAGSWSQRTYVELADDAGSAVADARDALTSADALLVMGDGTARRDPKAPGGFDERAEAFDETVARALAGGDPGALAKLDRVAAADLLVSGLAAWVAVGQLLASTPAVGARLVADGAPYGVGYFVAWWPGGEA